MNDAVLGIYHLLPPSLRSVAASLRGLYLRSWRYGPETDSMVEEALEREGWAKDHWQKWREEKLGYVLHRAATRVPYYREQWASRRRRGDNASWHHLENWPILEKEVLRKNALAFLADDCNPRLMYHERTSGTTGTPLDLWWGRRTVQQWYALFEARIRRWNGVARSENWAILGGQPIVPAARKKAPFWVWNSPMKQVYLSGNHVSRSNTKAYLTALRDYSVTHMIAYSSLASFLADELEPLAEIAESLKVVITNAEPLFPWQRVSIAQGFRCEVRESYGMAEIVAAASECRFGALHMWPEVGWVEVLADSQDYPASIGETGRLVCTSLLNVDMPLIRYAVGDRSKMSIESPECPCLRRLPVISSIEGRVSDLLVTKDGRRIYWINPIFSGLPIREAQIVQERLDQLHIRYAPAHNFALEVQDLIASRLQTRMGKIQVSFEQMETIPRDSSGKFRPVVSRISG